MHDSVMKWVQKKVTEHRLGRLSVLDVGALSVNGCVRHMFDGGQYVGTDMRPGKNVDVVCNAHALVATFGERRFDAVLCLEMLEHDDAFWVSMEQMGRVLRPGGRLLLTTRGIGFPLHSHPDDYWRFTVSAGHVLARLANLSDAQVEVDTGAPGILLSGVSKNVPSEAAA